jgi:hypothetical protein
MITEQQQAELEALKAQRDQDRQAIEVHAQQMRDALETRYNAKFDTFYRKIGLRIRRDDFSRPPQEPNSKGA